MAFLIAADDFELATIAGITVLQRDGFTRLETSACFRQQFPHPGSRVASQIQPLPTALRSRAIAHQTRRYDSRIVQNERVFGTQQFG